MAMRSATRSSLIMSISAVALHVLGVAARGAGPAGREVGLAAELHDARRRSGRRGPAPRSRARGTRPPTACGVDAGRHEVVALVAQHAHDLGRERLVEQCRTPCLSRPAVAGRHRAVLDVLPRALADRLDVGQEAHFLSPHGAGVGHSETVKHGMMFRQSCLREGEGRADSPTPESHGRVPHIVPWSIGWICISVCFCCSSSAA